jgi:hypothetical protein
MGSPVQIIRKLLGKPIRAYHGSPHSFSRFDASKIGTGEGAQAWGHGLYFAEKEGTADWYRKKLAEDADAPERWARDYWEAVSQPDHAGSPPAAYEYLRDYLSSVLSRNPDPHYAAAENWLLSQDPRLVPPPVRQGHMYEVAIDRPDSSLLDWDKPVGAALAGRLDARMAGDIAAEAQRMAGMGQLPRHMQILNRIASGEPDLATGEMVYRAAGRFDPPAARPGWGSVTNTINDSLTNQVKATERLMEAGIPGIRYLDEGSRSAGEGTHNYVMFPGTEDQIRILRKFGLLPPLAGGLALQEE